MLHFSRLKVKYSASYELCGEQCGAVVDKEH